MFSHIYSIVLAIAALLLPCPVSATHNNSYGANLLTKSAPADKVCFYDPTEDTYHTFSQHPSLGTFDELVLDMATLSDGRTIYTSGDFYYYEDIHFLNVDGTYGGILLHFDYFWIELLSIRELNIVIASGVDYAYVPARIVTGIFSTVYPNDYFLCSDLNATSDHIPIYNDGYIYEGLYACHFITWDNYTAAPLYTEPAGYLYIDQMPQSIELVNFPAYTNKSMNLLLLHDYVFYNVNPPNDLDYYEGRMIKFNFRANPTNGVLSTYSAEKIENYEYAPGLYIDFLPYFDAIASYSNVPIQFAVSPTVPDLIFLCGRGYGVTAYIGNESYAQFLDTDYFDIMDCEFDNNGILYTTDYTGFYTISAWTENGEYLAELGPDYGDLGGSISMTIIHGPYAGECEITAFPNNLTIGMEIEFDFELKDSSGLMYDVCEAPGSMGVDQYGYQCFAQADVLDVYVIEKIVANGEVFSRTVDYSSQVEAIGNGTYRLFYTPTTATIIAEEFVDGEWQYIYDQSVLGEGLNQTDLALLAPEYSFHLQLLAGVFKTRTSYEHNFYVKPAAALASEVTLETQSYSAVAGETYSVDVVFRDSNGNRIYNGGDIDRISVYANDILLIPEITVSQLEFAVVEASSRSSYHHRELIGNKPEEIRRHSQLTCDAEDRHSKKRRLSEIFVEDYRVTMEDNMDGSYTLDFFTSVQGVTIYQVKVDDESISSPLTAIILSSAMQGNFSTVTGDGLANYELGVPATFLITPHDQYDNIIPYTSSYANNIPFNIEFGFDSKSARVSEISLEYLSDGLIEVNYIVQADDDDPKTREHANGKRIDIALFCTIDGSYVENTDRVVQVTDDYVVNLSLEKQTQEEDDDVVSAAGYLNPLTPAPYVNTFSTHQQDVYVSLEVSTASTGWGVFILVVGLIMSIGAAILVGLWKDENVIKFAQFKFLYVILVGIILGFISPLIIAGSQVTVSSCVAELFTSNLSIVLIGSGLLVKTWRVSKIANNQTLAKIKVSDEMLLQILACFVGVGLLLMILAVTVGGPFVNDSEGKSTIDNKTGTTTHYMTDLCYMEDISYFIAVVVYEAILVGYCVVLAYTTRHVHAAFSENKWIALSVYNFAVIGVLTLVLFFSLKLRKTNPSAAFIILAFGIFVCIGGVLNLIFLPKFFSIIMGEEVTMNDFISGSYKSSGRKLSSKSGKPESGGRKSEARSGEVKSSSSVTHNIMAGKSSSGSSGSGEGEKKKSAFWGVELLKGKQGAAANAPRSEMVSERITSENPLRTQDNESMGPAPTQDF